MQRGMLGVCAVGLTIIAVGCGGTDPLTKAQFTRKADAVCAQAVREIGKTPPANGTGLYKRFLAYHKAKAAGIGALKPPQDLQARYDQYLTAVTIARNLFQRTITAEHAKANTDSITARLEPALQHEERLAAALGIKSCVEPQYKSHRS